MAPYDLSGKVALVTGAARGIGAAVALELLRAGAAVVAGVRLLSTADELEASLRGVGGQYLVQPCDVTRYAEVEAAVEGSVERFGRLDILVNNAGVIGPIARLEEADPAAWAENITVNLVGAMHGCRAALPHMLAQGGGVIINISSGAAHRPLEGWSAYCAGKAGMAMLTRSLALEAGPRGVRAYGLKPGVVDTGMQGEIRASGVNEVSRLRREDLADPRGPALAAAWLCTDAAADLAGQELDVRDPDLRRRARLG
ncbi:MAG: hypothetical protein RLZZ387_3136 [Chloroflexota bacterium]|jgi:NAD(P)-dependent dehydrogenase (short-subunit alcohol dehydrogenase family)